MRFLIYLHIQCTGSFVRAVERDNLVYITIVEIALHILAGNDSTHAVTDKDVAGRELAIKFRI